jgi:PAS domain S-box-containing protein
MMDHENSGLMPEAAAVLAAVRLQGLVDGSMDAIISIDSQLRIVLFNPAAARIFGIPIEDALGRSIEEFIPARFRSAHGSHVRTFGKDNRTSRNMGQGGQIVGLRANGEEFPAEASISQFETDGQRIFTVFLRDVTANVQIREALDHSRLELEKTNQMLARTAAMAKIGGWDLDLQTTTVTFSEEAARLHEVDHPYIPPKLSQGDEFYPPHAWPTIKAAVDAAIELGTPYDLESPFITAKGRHLWVRVQGFPIRENGKTIKLLGTFQDITDRVKAEEVTRALAKRLTLAARAGGLGIWDFDVVNNTLVWDDAMYTLYGISANTFGGAYEAWRAGVHPDDQAMGDAEVQASLYKGQDFDTEFRVLWPNGEVRTIRAIASVLRDAEGNPLRMVGTNWDITSQKANEAALQISLKDKEALLKEVHHRVKNNLQVIISLLRLEEQRSAAPESIHVLKTMQGRIFSMSLLHESLYRSGTFASVDLGDYLGKIAAQAHRTQLTQDEPVRLRMTMGSLPVGMDQAISCGLLLNELVSNCLKHGFKDGRAGEVRVVLEPANPETVQEDALWRLRVSDTGVGLPPDFEEKRQTSLGLQLVGDLSQQVKGKLQIESQPGAGAEFEVIFKALPPAALVMPA